MRRVYGVVIVLVSCSPFSKARAQAPAPFAFADFSWIPGNAGSSERPLTVGPFTGEFRISGTGGVTPPGGNQGAPGSAVTDWAPDLVQDENRMTLAMLVKL